MDNLQDVNLNIGVISDIIFAPHLIPLMKTHFGENINIYPIPYGEQNDDTYREQIKESDMVLVWLNLESSYLHAFDVLCSQPDSEQRIIEDVFTSCKKLYAEISAFSNAIILWFLLEDYFIKLPVVLGYSYTSATVKLYSVSVSDRFSDLGLVGAIEVEGDALTLFSLSCRALGREIEKKMIEFISDKYQIKKIEFESTGKNETVKTLLSESFPNAAIVNREIL